MRDSFALQCLFKHNKIAPNLDIMIEIELYTLPYVLSSFIIIKTHLQVKPLSKI